MAGKEMMFSQCLQSKYDRVVELKPQKRCKSFKRGVGAKISYWLLKIFNFLKPVFATNEFSLIHKRLFLFCWYIIRNNSH